MRLTALILGLFAGIGTFVHTFLRYVLEHLKQIDALDCYNWEVDFDGSIYSGVLMSVTALVAAGVVIQFPRASFCLFALTALVGFVIGSVDTKTYSCILPDALTAWGWLFAICAVFAFFGQDPDRRWPLNLIVGWLRKQGDE